MSYRQIAWPDDSTLRTWHHDDELSTTEIAARLDVSAGGVHYRMKTRGIETRSRAAGIRTRKRKRMRRAELLHPDVLGYAFLVERRSAASIAEDIGCDVSTVNRTLRASGFPPHGDPPTDGRRGITDLSDIRSGHHRRFARYLLKVGIPFYPVFEFIIPGEWFRIDVAYPELQFAIEVDGRDHVGVLRAALDKLRDARLKAIGWESARVPFFELQTRSKLRRASMEVKSLLLRRARARGTGRNGG